MHSFPSSRSRMRVRRLLVLILIIALAYFLWPVSKIEKISEQLDEGSQRRARDIASDSDDSDELYQPISHPVRGNFNPDSNRIEIPHVIKPDAIDRALVRLGLRPIRQVEGEIKTDSVSGAVSDNIKVRGYRSLDKLKAFVGNWNDRSFFGKNYNCAKVLYKDSGDVLQHTEPQLIRDDRVLMDIQQYLKSSGYGKQLGITSAQVNPKTWFQFGGSSVWLPSENCYLLVSRVMYAPTKRSAPTVSFVRMQAFDADWKELRDRRIRYNGVTNSEADAALSEYSLVEKNYGKQGQRILDRISMKFPCFMDIEIDTAKINRLMGPEDPRIIYREETAEPVVIFNMRRGVRRRSMHAAFPLRRKGPQRKVPYLQFIHTGSSTLTIKAIEKNWMPFFEKDVKDSVSFVYGLDPLVVFRCRLDNGKCAKIQDKDGYGTGMLQRRKIALRGGTNLVPVPQQLVDSIDPSASSSAVQMWVGFAKFHAWKCGCGSAMYRPVLFLLVKIDGEYRVDMMSDGLDFGLDVMSFDGKTTTCTGTGPNVLTPNSVAFWNIEIPDDADAKTRYVDFLGLTVSEADRNNRIVFVKNIANYILGVYRGGSRQLVLEDTLTSERTRTVEQCVLNDSLDYCRTYGLRHI